MKTLFYVMLATLGCSLLLGTGCESSGVGTAVDAAVNSPVLPSAREITLSDRVELTNIYDTTVPDVADPDKLRTTMATERLLFKYDDAGVPHAFKRIERNIKRDFWYHWARQAYTQPIQNPKVTFNTDQAMILETLGKPDWIRKTFRSLENDKVQEWIYAEENKLYQFINGRLVYDGPFTDYEQTLIRLGYPDDATYTLDNGKMLIATFSYRNHFWGMRQDEFHFIDGVLVQSIEGY